MEAMSCEGPLPAYGDHAYEGNGGRARDWTSLRSLVTLPPGHPAVPLLWTQSSFWFVENTQ